MIVLTAGKQNNCTSSKRKSIMRMTKMNQIMPNDRYVL